MNMNDHCLKLQVHSTCRIVIVPTMSQCFYSELPFLFSTDAAISGDFLSLRDSVPVDNDAHIHLDINYSVVIETIETNWDLSRSPLSEQIFQAICEEKLVDLIYSKRIRNMIYSNPFVTQKCLWSLNFASRKEILEGLQYKLDKTPVWQFKVLASEFVDRDEFLSTCLEYAKREKSGDLNEVTEATKDVNEVDSEESSDAETVSADEETETVADEESMEKWSDEASDVLPTMTTLSSTYYQGIVSNFCSQDK